jgi:hypothetical protein
MGTLMGKAVEHSERRSNDQTAADGGTCSLKLNSRGNALAEQAEIAAALDLLVF